MNCSSDCLLVQGFIEVSARRSNLYFSGPDQIYPTYKIQKQIPKIFVFVTAIQSALENTLHLLLSSAKSGPETTMIRKNERPAAKLLVENCFNKVTEFWFVVNKWIAISVWYDSIIQKVDNEFGTEISQSYFKQKLIALETVSSNLSLPSSHGFYYRKARHSKGGRA